MATNGQLETGNRRSALLCDRGARRWWSYGSYLPTPHDKKVQTSLVFSSPSFSLPFYSSGHRCRLHLAPASAAAVERTTASCLPSVRGEGAVAVDVIRLGARDTTCGAAPTRGAWTRPDSPHSGHDAHPALLQLPLFIIHGHLRHSTYRPGLNREVTCHTTR